MHKKKVVFAGLELTQAGKAVIMLHGRGGNAEDILSLSAYLPLKHFALLAPQATNNSWYPYSFLVLPARNEPWLSSAISFVKEVVNDVIAAGIPANQIYFLGFSQGACLTLEFVSRNALRYGGVVAFTGGLIGDKIYPENYTGDFEGTPVFIGTSNPDPHIPVERVYATANILKNMHADVMERIYNDMGHTINQDELDSAKLHVFKASADSKEGR